MNNKIVRKKCVLIVDDEPRIGRILGQKFKVCGYDVVVVTGGAAALEAVKAQTLDVILLDIMMPGVDGFQVLERLRVFSKVPVITFSARLENGPMALALGANEFLSKPFDLDDLVSLVSQYSTLGDR